MVFLLHQTRHPSSDNHRNRLGVCHTCILGNSRQVSKTLQLIVSKDKEKVYDLDLGLNNLLF